MKARWIVTAAAAALATCSTRRPIHPSFRYCPVMAYEAATGTVVFGGDYYHTGYGTTFLADTWTWG
jgi:hypothetical protein